MVNNQIRTTLEHEKIAGAIYGQTLGGQYYDNLGYYTEPAKEFAEHYHRGACQIVDIGGGSGIVGCNLLKIILNQGRTANLEVLDINPEQLAGVKQETERAGVPEELVHPERFDILADHPQKYDIACMRKVLHYFNEDANKKLVRRLSQFLNKGGRLILGALCEHTPFQEEYREMVLNYIEERMSGGQKFHRRHVQTDRNLERGLRDAGFAILDSFGEYYERATPDMMKEKWGLNDNDIQSIEALGAYEDFSQKPTASMADIEFCSRLRRVIDPSTKEEKTVFGNPYFWRNKVYVCERL